MVLDLVQARRLTRGGGRRIRVAADLTLRELAAEVGVDAATLYRWERGEGKPRGEAAVRWVRALESISSLLDQDVFEQVRASQARVTSREIEKAPASLPAPPVAEPGSLAGSRLAQRCAVAGPGRGPAA